MLDPETTTKDARYAYISLWHRNKGIMQNILPFDICSHVHDMLYGTPAVDKTMQLLPIYHDTILCKLHRQYELNRELASELIGVRLLNMSLVDDRREMRERTRVLRRSLRSLRNRRRANYEASNLTLPSLPTSESDTESE